MNQVEIDALLETTSEKRYEYFVKKVVDFEVVWGLFSNKTGWALVENDNSERAVPFWPRKEFANLMMRGEWVEYVPKEINLKKFIEQWLPGMAKDQIKSVVFMKNGDTGIMVDPLKLQGDLLNELENY